MTSIFILSNLILSRKRRGSFLHLFLREKHCPHFQELESWPSSIIYWNYRAYSALGLPWNPNSRLNISRMKSKPNDSDNLNITYCFWSFLWRTNIQRFPTIWYFHIQMKHIFKFSFFYFDICIKIVWVFEI